MGDSTQIPRDFTTSLVLVLLVFIIFGGCAKSYYTARECPAGYELITAYSSPEFETYCGTFEEQKQINYRCCQRISNVNEICTYNIKNKEVIQCTEIVSFNTLKVCTDNTPCGISTTQCSGAYCGNGFCAFENNQAKCLDRLELNQKEVLVTNDLNCGEQNLNNIGGKCDNNRLCVFDISSQSGNCLGGFFGLSLEEAKLKCEPICKQAIEDYAPSQKAESNFCKGDKFPVIYEIGNAPILKSCNEIYQCSSVNCNPIGGVPQQ